jgi:hypothetical protein
MAKWVDKDGDLDVGWFWFWGFVGLLDLGACELIDNGIFLGNAKWVLKEMEVFRKKILAL